MLEERALTDPAAKTGLQLLSPRELEVLDRAAIGLTNAQIAIHMGLTVHAVKFHLAGIYRKLGVANRTEAAVLFLRTTPTGPS